MTALERLFEGQALDNFLKGFRSEETKESYSKKLRVYLEHHRLNPDDLKSIASKTRESSSTDGKRTDGVSIAAQLVALLSSCFSWPRR